MDGNIEPSLIEKFKFLVGIISEFPRDDTPELRDLEYINEGFSNMLEIYNTSTLPSWNRILLDNLLSSYVEVIEIISKLAENRQTGFLSWVRYVEWHHSNIGHEDNAGTGKFVSLYNGLAFKAIEEKNNGLLKSAFEARNQFEVLKDQEEKELRLIKEQASSLLSDLQTIGQITYTERYVDIFKNEAEKNNTMSKVWLWVAIVLTLAFPFFTHYIDWFYPFQDKINDIAVTSLQITIQLISRILIISFMLFIVSFTFKQFRVNRHLYTININRANAIESFKLFIDSISKDDLATRNSLTLEVAKAIYNINQTGYVSSDNDTPDFPSIINTIGSIKSS